MKKILIVDDERAARKGMLFTLKPISGEIKEAESKKEADRILEQMEFDLVICDLRLPTEIMGLSLIKTIKEKYPFTAVLAITAYGSIDSAVKAMKYGADDYITKDFSSDEILLKIEKMLETRNLRLANKRISEKLSDLEKKYGVLFEPNKIIGEDPKIKNVLHLAKRIAHDNDSTVLITGESGTGKELIARFIHQHSPERSKHKFVVVDIANMPSTLLESHLFGHEKGAFTNAHQQHIGLFEMANHGTIFLDEIGDFPIELQVKLLRVLQEKTFYRVGGSAPLVTDVRIIAATNKNIDEMVKNNLFREDLFYRLNVVRLHLPPLRERKSDIPLLIEYFQKILEVQKGRKLIFPEKIIKKMTAYDWRGNIRQLQNVMESLYVICPGSEVRETDLNLQTSAMPELENQLFTSLLKMPFKEARKKLLHEFERVFLSHYLEIYQGNISKIASVVGESREGLSKKIKKYGLKDYQHYRK